nr:metallophosphoesterase [Halomicrobium salinisoli]
MESDVAIMLVLGDAHAAEDPDNDDALLAAYDAADADVALQLGDLQRYDLPAPTWFVGGNNEDFDVIDALRAGDSPEQVSNAHLLAGTAAEVEGLRVAGLSGNYAPTQYDKPRSELSGERRRHFVREDVEAVAALEDVDVLMTHEAPEGLVYYGYDAGCEHVTRLVEGLDPDLCLVGHHETHREATVHGVRAVSLAPVWQCYYRLDPETLELTVRETPNGDD